MKTILARFAKWFHNAVNQHGAEIKQGGRLKIGNGFLAFQWQGTCKECGGPRNLPWGNELEASLECSDPDCPASPLL